jgi:hypothetical protein
LSESKNLAASHPAQTAALRQRLLRYLDDVNARLPIPNAKYSP